MGKYCSNCGTENDEKSKFCKNCGKNLFGLHDIDKEDKDSSNDINNQKILIGVVVVLVIAIAIVGAYAFMSFNNDNVNTESSSTNNNGNFNSNNNVDTVTSSSIPLSEVPGLARTLADNLNSKDIQEISSVQYKGVTFTKPQCLYIFAKAIEMKNSGIDGNINFKSFGPPDSPLNAIITSYLTKSEYVDMAQRTSAWMDKHGKAPNYAGIVVAGSPDFGYDGLVLAFAIAIMESENGSLPSSISW